MIERYCFHTHSISGCDELCIMYYDPMYAIQIEEKKENGATATNKNRNDQENENVQ